MFSLNLCLSVTVHAFLHGFVPIDIHVHLMHAVLDLSVLSALVYVCFCVHGFHISVCILRVVVHSYAALHSDSLNL